MSMRVSSTAFNDHGEIPPDYTADGRNVAPPLSIDGVPQGTRSLVLVVDDPDAPDPAAPRSEPFVHWVVYDLPPTTSQLSGGTPELPGGASEGINGWGKRGYGGPKPPIGRHRYFFKLYALDTAIESDKPLTKDELLERIDGHVIEKAELVGSYAKAA